MTYLDNRCKTITWLDYDACIIDGKRVVTKLKYKVCNIKSKISGEKYFYNIWIEGTDSLRTSSNRDDANSDQNMSFLSIILMQH